jgi:tRNA 2-thiocytidine biosynthesis protein TtcA
MDRRPMPEPELEKRLLRRISRLNRTWTLLEAGDRVMVACSGGKDSWALLHLLRAYQQMVPFPFEIVAMNLDQGHPGFDVAALQRHFEAHGFDHHIETRDTYSVVKANTPDGKTYCSRCSRMRRGILHRVARELGANKIALGHHRDDVVETVLLSMMYAGQIRAMPAMRAATDDGCALIRPLVTCSERDLEAYARATDAPIVPCNLCGSEPHARRRRVRALLAQLEVDHPRLRETLFAALGNVRVDSLYDLSLRGHGPPAAPALRVVSENIHE